MNRKGSRIQLDKDTEELMVSILNDRVNLMNAAHKANLLNMFKSLDVNGDGVITYDDFQDQIPMIHEYKQRLCTKLMGFFDYDKSQSIELKEFMGYFIARTLFDINNHPPIPSGNLYDQMAHWQNVFNTSLATYIQEFFKFVNQQQGTG
eukprot:g4287.t1